MDYSAPNFEISYESSRKNYVRPNDMIRSRYYAPRRFNLGKNGPIRAAIRNLHPRPINRPPNVDIHPKASESCPILGNFKTIAGIVDSIVSAIGTILGFIFGAEPSSKAILSCICCVTFTTITVTTVGVSLGVGLGIGLNRENDESTIVSTITTIIAETTSTISSTISTLSSTTVQTTLMPG
ncbi:hypothetical protein I4U23_000201 [Adineta vaga]|nr:hypothetical protein I4U23_000201 [Adineta vaga]